MDKKMYDVKQEFLFEDIAAESGDDAIEQVDRFMKGGMPPNTPFKMVRPRLIASLAPSSLRYDNHTNKEREVIK